MTFHDTRLPTAYQYSSQFGTGFQTVLQQTASGHEVRIARQSQGRHRFRISKQLQGNTEIAALKDFGIRMRGSLDSFRLKDTSDFTTATDGQASVLATNTSIGTGDGTEKKYQMVKWYNFGLTGAYARTITLPVSGTVLVNVNGVAQVLGVNFTVTSPGGVLTFTVAPPVGHVITAGFEFDVPARFEKNMDMWTAIRADATNVWSMPTLDCIEVLDEVEFPEKWEPGGTTIWGALSADFTIRLAQGTLHLVTAGAAINAFLPPAPTIHTGGPSLFSIRNLTGAAGAVQPRDDAGGAVGGTITAGNIAIFDLLVVGTTATWYRR